MKHKTRDIIVGFTALMGLGGIAFLLYIFGYVPQMLEPGYRIGIEFPHASGLNANSRVLLDGVDVGRLTTLTLQQPPKRGVLLDAQIRREFQIPAQARVTVDAKILGGSPALAFYTDHLTNEQVKVMLPVDGSAVVQGELQSMFGDLKEQLEERLNEPLEKFKQIADDFSKLSQQWTVVGKNISELTAPRTLQQVDEGKAQANLTTLLARTDQRMAQVKTMVAQMQATSEQWTAVGKDVRNAVDQMTQKLYATADDMSKTLNAVHTTVEQARVGEGTIGKLLNDPQLYHNLNDASERLNQMLDEINLLVQKIKAEGVNINL